MILNIGDKTFDVENDVLEVSGMISSMVEDLPDATDSVELPNVDAETFELIIEFCKLHKEEPFPKFETYTERIDKNNIPEKYSKLVDVEFEKLEKLVLAANFLDIKPLLDLVAKTIALQIRDKSVEEIRELFHIENDFTKEEEDAIREKYKDFFEE